METKVKKGQSLMEFKSQYAVLKRTHKFTDKENPENTYSSLAFYKTKEDAAAGVNATFVNFSSKLPRELTNAEIIRDKNILRVVQLDSGNYKLCYPSENSWEEIEL